MNLGALFEIHAAEIAAESERMGFVWLGDCEIDPRTAGGGRVRWGRSSDGHLWVREPLGEIKEWSMVDEVWWKLAYPHAPIPPRLPEESEQ